MAAVLRGVEQGALTMRETYRRIDRDNIDPMLTAKKVVAESNAYLVHRQILDDLRKAYMRGHITQEQLLTLRGYVKAGDATHAKKGLADLLGRMYG